ncbi:MAG: 3-phosphoshikimate 1-carboxyvinyltransferase [Candidatus Omnitrophota bacterium]|jgi:3-phosphoshikimate 1-carboxyvinyltransferase
MKPFLIKPASSLKGEILLPGDKSIAHRALILSAITAGSTEIDNFPANQDCLSTLKVFQKLGIKIIKDKTAMVTVYGRGLRGLKKPAAPIFVGDSGTTLRITLGILSGQNFRVTLKAGRSLSQRPMLRVTRPLRMMGARINSKLTAHGSKLEEYPPITITGGRLKAISYKMPVASAQVKSAILLAGLYARGLTAVVEPIKTRDHTERMLKLFKAGLKLRENKIVIKGNRELTSPGRIYIPGDISSASFFLVAAAILADSELLVSNVSLNPSRLGIIKVLQRMGADIKVQSSKARLQSYEPMGDLLIKSSALRGVIIKRAEVPSLIDELPILMVAASLARGKTVFEGVEELRLKETDRIRSMSENLRKMGVKIQTVKADNCEKIIIKSAKQLIAAKVRSFGDHRTAMSMVVAGLKARGATFIDNITCIDKSFPGFLRALKNLTA